MGVSEECQEGNCPDCHGNFRVEEFGISKIFCTHDCHRKRNQEKP
jgi:hypothetical protein